MPVTNETRHGFHPLEVVDVRRETKDALSVSLRISGELQDTFAYKSGQHLAVRAIIGGEEIRRTYSISSGPDDPCITLTMKKVPEGLFSAWAHQTLKPGSRLECMAPAGRLVLPDCLQDQPRRIIAIAAGSGITPIVSIIEHALASEPETRVALVYGNRTVDDIIFRERLENAKDRYLQRLQIHHVLSRDAEADVPLLSGRVDRDKLTAIAQNLRPEPSDVFLLCGPGTLIKECRDALLAMGVQRDQIRFEYFRAGPESLDQQRKPTVTATPETITTGAEVIATLDGTRRTFRVPDGTHIIDAALAAGIKLPYSCKGGMCCTCRAKLVEGEVVMDRNFSLESWEIDAGFVLTCQSRPVTARVVLDYDRS